MDWTLAVGLLVTSYLFMHFFEKGMIERHVAMMDQLTAIRRALSDHQYDSEMVERCGQILEELTALRYDLTAERDPD